LKQERKIQIRMKKNKISDAYQVQNEILTKNEKQNKNTVGTQPGFR